MTDLKEPVLGRFPENVSISNSEIQTFKRCKRQWYLGNYRGLAPKEKSYIGPLSLGTRIHNALERYYTDGTNPVEEYNRLQRIDNKLFLETPDAQMDSQVKKFESESELGRIMVEGYFEWAEENNVDADIEVVAAETKFSYRMETDPRVEVIGKVDLEVRRAFDKSRAIFDHKSCVSMDDYRLHSHRSEQLMMYSFLAQENPDEDGNPIDGGTYNLLKKVKRTARATPPFYDRIDVRFNKHIMKNFKTRLEGEVRDMMAVRDALDEGADHHSVAYPSPKMDWTCNKCPFFQVCHMMDDGSAAEEFIEDHYEQVNPNARYSDENDTF